MAPLLAEHLASLMQNCRQSPLSVLEKLDTGPSSFTMFSPQDDNFYLLAFMINTKNLLYLSLQRKEESGRGVAIIYNLLIP